MIELAAFERVKLRQAARLAGGVFFDTGFIEPPTAEAENVARPGIVMHAVPTACFYDEIEVVFTRRDCFGVELHDEVKIPALLCIQHTAGIFAVHADKPPVFHAPVSAWGLKIFFEAFRCKRCIVDDFASVQIDHFLIAVNQSAHVYSS